MGAPTRILFSLMGGEEARPIGGEELIEGSVESAVETVKLGLFARREACVAGNGIEAGGAQGGVDALEELQEDEADGISLSG